MPGEPREKTVHMTVTVSQDEADLLEAWRCQHSTGRESRARAIRMILGVYLGAERWRGGPAGHGVAWAPQAGWHLIDPRRLLARERAEGLADLAPIEERLATFKAERSAFSQPSHARLKLV